MEVSVDRASDRETRPWGKHYGQTSDLLLVPDDLDTFRIMVGITTIESRLSDFSAFPGMTRIQVLLSGSLELSIDGRLVSLDEPASMVEFSGDSQTSCRFTSPLLEVLNVIHGGEVMVVDCKSINPKDTPIVTLGEQAYIPEMEGATVVYEVLFLRSGSLQVRIGLSDKPIRLSERDALTLKTTPQERESLPLQLSGEGECYYVSLIASGPT